VTSGLTAPPREVRPNPLRQEYRPKKKEEMVQNINIDSEKTTGLDIIQIGTMNISLEDKCKGPILVGGSVEKPVPVVPAANDHEASSGTPNIFILSGVLQVLRVRKGGCLNVSGVKRRGRRKRNNSGTSTSGPCSLRSRSGESRRANK
jgi:hypothetical protein